MNNALQQLLLAVLKSKDPELVSLALEVQASVQTPYKLSTTHNVVVSQGQFWLPLSEAKSKSAKCQVLTRYGVACYGSVSATKDIVAWAPLPKIPEWLTALQVR